MARLSREIVRKLAALRALSLWEKGAYGEVRLQKTLFFADKKIDPKKRLFGFKKYFLGQYSEEANAILNGLQVAGRLKCLFDGSAQRLVPDLPPGMSKTIRMFFVQNLPEWESSLNQAFNVWGHLKNNELLKKAHEDESYMEAEFDQVIFDSELPEIVDFPSLDEDKAEELADLVSEATAKSVKVYLETVAKSPPVSSDWRTLYFSE